MNTMQDIVRALLELKEANQFSYHRMMYELNRAMAHELLVENNGNRTKASRQLGITRSTFAKYIDMSDKDWKEENLYE